MAFIDWRIRGPEILNCNCDYGCPCQFMARPTRGDCRAVLAQRIDEGHFGETDLAGCKYVALVAWPGAIHEGDGEVLPVIDSSASEAQRQALLTILSNDETKPNKTIFNVFAATYSTVHEPQFHPIEFEWNSDLRSARLRVEGLVDCTIAPIHNPVTGLEHRARVVLPNGFEYREAEYASGRSRASGPVGLDVTDTHAHLATIDLSTHGAA